MLNRRRRRGLAASPPPGPAGPPPGPAGRLLLRGQQVLLRVRSLRDGGLRTSGLVAGVESHSADEGNLSLERALRNRWFGRNQIADNYHSFSVTNYTLKFTH
jgi:hypothetical protein